MKTRLLCPCNEYRQVSNSNMNRCLVRSSPELSATSHEHLVRPGDGFHAVDGNSEEGVHVDWLHPARTLHLPRVHNVASFQGTY